MHTFSPESQKVAKMYDYLVAPASPLAERSDVTFVFGRRSSHLVAAATKAARRSDYLVVSGNVGKDSGDLPFERLPEAYFVVDGVVAAGGIVRARTYCDLAAKNGFDNALNGIAIIQNKLALPRVGTLTAVMHSTQVRRLGGTLVRRAQLAGLVVDNMLHYPSGYPFDPTNPYDQYEAAGELLRVNNLSAPSKGDGRWLDRPDDLDPEMIEYAVALDEYYAAEFERRGILNPSTADNTNRYHPIMTQPLAPQE